MNDSQFERGKRLFARSVTLAATVLTCAGLQAQEQQLQDRNLGGAGQTESGQSKSKEMKGEKLGEKMTAESFVRHAAMGGQLEIQAGQMAQRQGHNEQVKELGQAMVQDHQKANQRLMQIAQVQNLEVDRQLDPEYQQKLNKLQGKSGQEFDKEFVKHAVRAHQIAIKKFEKAAQELQDAPELRSFANQNVEMLRKHLEQARDAARSVGVDDNALAAEMDVEEPGVGAPPAGVIGDLEGDQEEQQLERRSNEQEELEEPVDLDQPRTSAEQGRDFSATANVEADENDLVADNANVEYFDETTDEGDEINFKEGDGEILGLPTSNNDGTILGLFPAPSARIEAGSEKSYTAAELKDGDVDPGVDTVQEANTEAVAVGGPAVSQSEGASSQNNSQAPEEVKETLREQGWVEGKGEIQRMTVYQAEVNGRKVLIDENGEILSRQQN